MRLVRIAQHSPDALLLPEFGLLFRCFLKRFKRISNGWFSNSRRRLLHWPAHLRVGIVRLRRRKARRLLVNDDGALQLPVELRKIFLLFRIEVHHRARNNTRRARRPSRRRDRQGMLGRTHNAGAAFPTRPRTLHRPALQMSVHRAVLREHVPRPLVRLLELRRARQPRPDAVREVFEVCRRLAVLANLAENLRIRCRKGTLLVASRFRQAAAHRHQNQNHAAHKHTESTQAHSSTSNAIWIFATDSTTRQQAPAASYSLLRRSLPAQPFRARLRRLP